MVVKYYVSTKKGGRQIDHSFKKKSRAMSAYRTAGHAQVYKVTFKKLKHK